MQHVKTLFRKGALGARNIAYTSLLGLLIAQQALGAVPGRNSDLIVEKTIKVGDKAAPDASAVAEFKSTTKGLLPPRMTEAQRDAIASPAAGLEVWNTTTGKKNVYDGTAWKEVAGGGGGSSGFNLLKNSNPDFESGLTNWSNSGGSFTLQATSSSSGLDTKFLRFNSSASSQTVTSAAINVATGVGAGLAGGNGFGSCFFKTAATDYKLQVYDGTNVLAERTIPALSSMQEIGVAFPIPTSGTVALRLISQSDAADLDVDNCFLGSMPALNVSQATVVADGRISCSTDPTTTSGSVAAFTAGATCTTAYDYLSGNGSWSTANANLPKWPVTGLSPGLYVVEITTGLANTGSNGNIVLAVNDGTTTTGNVINSGSTAANGEGVVVGLFPYTAPASPTFSLFASTTGGTLNLRGNYHIVVKRYPVAQEQGFRPDQVAWYVDANISGANPDLGTADVTDYASGVIENGSLTLTQNSGSIGVQIPCSSTNAPSGTTCSAGNESVGVSFTAPSAGTVKACASFSYLIQTGAGGGNEAAFEIVETPVNAQTISQEGKERVEARVLTASTSVAFPVRICGTFPLASAGQKVFRLRYEQDATATLTNSTIFADASSTIGQRDIHWEVYPINQAIPAPLLVGSVTSNSAGLERVERASVLADTACVINKQSGSWLGAPTSCATGLATFALSGFSDRPACVVALENSTGIVACRARSLSQTSLTVECINSSTGASTAGNASIICMGPR
jgi:hypothetical protein